MNYMSCIFIFFSPEEGSLLCYSHFKLAAKVLKTLRWFLSDQNSIRWATQGTLSSREQVSLQHTYSTARGLHINLSHPYIHSTTIKLYLFFLFWMSEQELYLHKGVNKQKLTLTEVPFHHSNAKVTQSLQILSKAYNKLSKTPNCDQNTFCVCAMLMLQIICIWSNLNAGSKTTFPLISQDCFHCTHLHQQDMLLLCSFPPPQAPVQVQKSWPLQCTRYELIAFLNRTQQQSGNRHWQGSFLWKELQGQMVTMKL